MTKRLAYLPHHPHTFRGRSMMNVTVVMILKSGLANRASIRFVGVGHSFCPKRLSDEA